MAWQPDEGQMRQLAGYLRDSLTGRDPNKQRYATMMLGQAKASPDITNYLMLILKSDAAYLDQSRDQSVLARSAAAMTLKNFIKTHYSQLPPDQMQNVRKAIVPCLNDSVLQIRNVTGNVITEIVKQGGVLGWPDVYGELFSMAESKEGHTDRGQEGAISTILKICEDNSKALTKEHDGQRPIDALLPKLYELTTSENARVRALALECINIFLPLKPKVLIDSIGTLMSHLFRLAVDPSDDVRRFVCRCFVQLVDTKPEALLPHMDGLVDYMVTQQRNTEEPDLALEAAEFWLSLGEHEKLGHNMGPYLPKVIPMLLESMVYSEDDIARLEGERDDADQEDRVEDIKPQFATSKRGAVVSTKPTTNGLNGANGNIATPDDELSEGEIEEKAEDDEEEDPEDEWNLRKCSAAALDVLASFFPEAIFEVSLPYLKQNLTHADWPNREAAVLAFGAVAEGCEAVVAPYLPELIPFLCSLLQDREPVVRKITCWALGRYTRWVVHLEHQSQQEMAKYLEMIVTGILQTMLDRNKSVQEGAASAFSTLEEIAGERLTPYCLPIVQQFVKCFGLYKDRNMFILYDCVQTLAEQVGGPGMKDPEVERVLMSALTQRWQAVSDHSRELFPLLECLSYVAPTMGLNFAPYAIPIWTRCIQVVHQNLEEGIQATKNEALDKPDKDFLVTSLDLLSSVVQALGPDSGQLVTTSEPRMFDLLRFCMQDPSNDVRQSSYALLGDCAINIFPHLQPVLPAFLPLLVTQLDIASVPDEVADSSFAVLNNACWSCGEIARVSQADMLPYIDRLYERLSNIILSDGIPESVNENAGIALGRLGLHYSQNIAPHLAIFAKAFLNALKPVEGTNEKGQAFMGLNQMVLLNPQALGDCLPDYLSGAADLSITNPSKAVAGLNESFDDVFKIYKAGLPNFSSFVGQLSPKQQKDLAGHHPVVNDQT